MYYKIVDDGYIIAIGKNLSGTSVIEITEEEYLQILELVNNQPVAPDGHAIRLKTDLTWEIYELSFTEEEQEVTAEEALAELVEVLQ